jgi:thiol:disulfide interchange protein DsbD
VAASRSIRRLSSVLLFLAAALPARAADDPVRARLESTPTEAVAEVTIAPGWHVNAHAPRDEFLIPTTLAFSPPPGQSAGAVTWPAPVEHTLAFSPGKPLLLYEGTLRLMAPLTGTPAAGSPPLRASLRYQACNDSTCLPPRTLDLIAAPPTRRAAAASGEGNAIADFVARWGWGATFLWVGLLGLALNLTPCVYPMISVTVAFFGGRTGAESTRIGHALLYVLGICITFSLLGVVAALTGSLFGGAMQQPAVLWGIALLMVALALSNFGFYQLRMPSVLVQAAGRGGEGAFGAFFMGLTMGVVGAPCIGPIVAALLLYVGAQQSAALGFALFFTLGLGLGLPYLALAPAAGRLRRLPRSGAWLAWVERLFGFVLLGLALHFVTPLLSAAVVRSLWAVLLVVAGVVLGFLGTVAGEPVGYHWARRLAGVAAIVVGLSSLLGVEGESPIVWMPFSEEAIAQATQSRRPVLIDFQAAWCLPCREMDRTTFRDPAVVRATRDFAALRADVTAQDEHAEALMTRWEVPGVPTYVILGPDGQERRRFVGFVPADRMLEGLRAAAGAARG